MKNSLIFVFLSFFLHPLIADDITIYPNMDSGQIKKAIENATGFDTIHFLKGEYRIHDILIKKPLAIIGQEHVIFNGENKYEILLISAQNVLIRNIEFINSGYSSLNDFASIKLVDAAQVTLENNKISNSFFAIHMSNSHHCIIRNNTIVGNSNSEQLNGNAIHAWKCHHLIIENNTVSNHRDGIYLEFVTHSQIRGNYSTRQLRYGLHFMFSNDDVYEKNIFKNNGAGVAVMYSKRVNMNYNSFLQNIGPSSYGLLLKDISDGEISHNVFKENTKGIDMEGSNRLKLNHNLIEDNGWGISIQASCMDNVLTCNNFINNTFDVTTNGNVIMNTFDKNYWDSYSGYDLNRDGLGDVPHRPLSMMSVMMEQNESVLILMKSFIIQLFEKLEKVIPTLTPEAFIDNHPIMKSYEFN